MVVKCPVCKKQWDSSLKVARHIFGTGDRAHKAWVNSQGVSFTDLLIRQATASGNQSFLILGDIIEKAQASVSENLPDARREAHMRAARAE